MYCFMSFAIPLALGGGPACATLEVSIYAAVSGQQDFARAGSIAMIEGVCAVGVLARVVSRVARPLRAVSTATMCCVRSAWYVCAPRPPE